MSKKKSEKEQVKKQVSTGMPFNRWIIGGALSVIVLIVYFPSLKLNLTELDDKYFIYENIEYNKNISNLTTSFHRGVFAEKKDAYFRPILLNSYILNYRLSKDNIKGYHLVNIVLHLLSVLLLWLLLLKLKLPDRQALLLAIVFAVHPALAQAVSWIPGRNDTLLAIFSFGFMIMSIDYLQTRKWPSLIAAFFLLLVALFTKESALFIPFGTFFILLMVCNIQWKEKHSLLLYSVWGVAMFILFIVRSKVALENETYAASVTAANFFSRIPVLIQYFGKTILPFNLNVFPILEDNTYLYGAAAIVIVGAALLLAGNNNKRVILAGFGWFLLMLLPVVLLPASLNNQDFEHRLYVPFLGILLVLSQTALFTRLKPAAGSVAIGCIAVLFAAINIRHQQKFSDPVTFWEAAVSSSPHSSYAAVMLSARLQNTDVKRANELLLNAYSLNPKEAYVNYYIGKMYLDSGNWQKAESYLLDELKLSNYFLTNFALSRVEFEKKNFTKSIEYMEIFLHDAPRDPNALNNYILMLIDTGQKQKARDFIIQKQKEGIELPKDLIDKAQ